jgi:hypothetical protein
MAASWLNVLDFGAFGDGIHMDGLAIQAAIDSTQPTGGGSIIIPSGTYRINKPIEIKHDNVTLFGMGPSSIIQNVGNEPSIEISGVEGSHSVSFTKIAQLTLNGGQGSGAGKQHGISSNFANGLRVEDVIVKNHKGHGFYAVNSLYVNIDGGHFLSNCGNGIHLDATTQGVTVGGSFRTHDNGGDGIRITGGAQGRTILAGVSEGNKGWGIHFDGHSVDTRVIGTYFESNGPGEILVGDQADGCSLIGVITAGGTTKTGRDPKEFPDDPLTDCLVIGAAKRVVVMASRFNRPITINGGAREVMFAMNHADFAPAVAPDATVSIDFDNFFRQHLSNVASISASGTKASNFINRVPLAAGQHFCTVSLAGYGGQELDANYEIFISPSWLTSYRVYNQTATAFTVEFSDAPTIADSYFSWLLLHQ